MANGLSDQTRSRPGGARRSKSLGGIFRGREAMVDVEKRCRVLCMYPDQKYPGRTAFAWNRGTPR